MLKYALAVLIGLRIWIALISTGYIHPDEYFQNAEVAAAEVFDYGVNSPELLLTWEWTSPGVRSIVPVKATLGIFFTLLRPFRPSARMIVLAERGVMLILSLTVDWAVYSIRGELWRSCVLAASPVMLVFMVRPFSNSLETVAMAVASVALERRTGGLLLGTVAAMGAFVRPTFVGYLGGLSFEHAKWIWQGRRRIVPRAVASFAAVASVFVVADSQYFGCWTLTPWNFISYNVQSAAADHARHPWYVHALVNMPLLFLPLVLLARPSASVALPLFFLSLISHQEPRFLLPLVVPLVLSLRKPTRAFWIVVVGHTTLVVLFFGFLHQGGLLPVLFRLNDILSQRPPDQHVHILFWKTFMPPRHLLLPLRSDAPRISVTDLAGAPVVSVMDSIHRSSSFSDLFLVVPSFLAHGIPEGVRVAPLLQNVGCHLDTDRLGDLLTSFSFEKIGLDVYFVPSSSG